MAEVELGRAARAYLTYAKALPSLPTDARAAIERMQEDQVRERSLARLIDLLARRLLPGPYASDGAVADRIAAIGEDSLQFSGDMWFLGDRASWKEPMQFVVGLQPSTCVVQGWTLSVGNAATGLRPTNSSGREGRRERQPPTEWLFVISGPG